MRLDLNQNFAFARVSLKHPDPNYWLVCCFDIKLRGESMSFAQKSIYAGLAAYLVAMFGALLFVLIDMDFTGYEVGRAVLLMLLATTGVVAYRFANGILRANSPNRQADRVNV